MTKRLHRFAPWALLILLCFEPAFAHSQTREPSRAEQFAIWSGANFANGHVVGFDQDRRFVQVGFTWAPILLRRQSFTLRYRADVIPVALLHDYRFGTPGKTWVYGGGLNPVGAQMDFHNRTRVIPFATITGGFLYFKHQVLAYTDTQFQFTVAPGVGFRIPLRGRTSLQFGYEYHHMSNANIDHVNPGLDSQIVYTGLCFFSR
jgi:hypothetical protein